MCRVTGLSIMFGHNHMRYLLVLFAFSLCAQTCPNQLSCGGCAPFAFPPTAVCYKEHCSISEDDAASAILVPPSVTKQFQDNTPSAPANKTCSDSGVVCVTGGDGVASVCNGSMCAVKVAGVGSATNPLLRVYANNSGVAAYSDAGFLLNFGGGNTVTSPLIDANSNVWAATACTVGKCGGTGGMVLIRWNSAGVVQSVG